MCSELHAPRPASMHPTPKQCPGTKNLTLGEREGEVGRGGRGWESLSRRGEGGKGTGRELGLDQTWRPCGFIRKPFGVEEWKGLAREPQSKSMTTVTPWWLHRVKQYE